MPREVQLALGRIFALASRPEQRGDAEQYETCRRLILDAAEREVCDDRVNYRPNYARDRLRGAAGD